MKVLLTGASGFIGSRLALLLRERGHGVVGVSRRPRAAARDGITWVEIDLGSAQSPGDWYSALQGVDVVVNAAGVFVDAGEAQMDAVHRRGPAALFAACAACGVARVVQVSALSDDAAADIAFIAGKRAADAVLLAMRLDAVVVRPSLVFGTTGESTRALLTMATLPVLALPMGTGGLVQPVHVDDVAQALLAAIEAPPHTPTQRCIALVGPQPLTLEGYLRLLRRSLGLGAQRVVHLPQAWIGLAARIGDRLPFRWLRSDALRLLERDSRASPAAIGTLLGRPPRNPETFIGALERDAVRTLSQLRWLLLLLRLSLATVWILSGIVSLGIYPVEASREMLTRVGVPAAWQMLLLYGAAALDIGLGVLTLLTPTRALWRTQMLLILLYMVIIAWWLPEYWIHPFGPVIKNLPMLALLVMLNTLHKDRNRPWSM